MADLISTKILGASQLLFGRVDLLARAKVARRDPMVELFAEVAACLDETAKSIRAGVYPLGRCQELLIYSVGLPSVVDEEVGAETAEAISASFREAHAVDELFGCNDTPEGEAEIAKLEEAARLLRALAHLVKVQPADRATQPSR